MQMKRSGWWFCRSDSMRSGSVSFCDQEREPQGTSSVLKRRRVPGVEQREPAEKWTGPGVRENVNPSHSESRTFSSRCQRRAAHQLREPRVNLDAKGGHKIQRKPNGLASNDITRSVQRCLWPKTVKTVFPNVSFRLGGPGFSPANSQTTGRR